MSLKTLVKINHVSNLSDARYCAGMGVEMLGFEFNTASTHYVTPQKMKEISGWLSGVKIVAEINNLKPENFIETFEEIHFDYIQVQNILLKNIKDLNYPIIYKIDWNEENTFDKFDSYFYEFKNYVSYFLISSEIEKIKPEDLKEINLISEKYNVLLNFNLSGEDFNHILLETKIKGIAINGNTEIKLGYTNTDSIADILETIEEE